jgi:adenosylhomocysteine nucleosidase
LGDVRPILVVTGLKREAASLPSHGVEILAGGGSPQRLAAELAVASPRAAGIVSFGMAGALDPTLELGDWYIGERLTGAFACECDPAWVAALAKRLPRARIGTAYCDGRLIGDPAEKLSLGASHGALAADMESHVAAEAARRAGLPFAVLRCISDEAKAVLPPAIAVAMRPGGGLALGAVLGSIVTQPRQVPELIGTLARFSRAYTALKAGARAAGPRLAFDLR